MDFFINIIPIGVLALFLSSRLVTDPPEFVTERASIWKGRELSIDGIGIALIALASAALELTLERGRIDDWLGSSFICFTPAVEVLGWIATVLWELHTKDDPVIHFRLLKSRNFAIASVLFFVFGFGLFGPPL